MDLGEGSTNAIFLVDDHVLKLLHTFERLDPSPFVGDQVAEKRWELPKVSSKRTKRLGHIKF